MSDLSLIAKIAKAALDVGGKLKADKTNKEQNYSYISADKILAICGQALSTQGVVVLPELSKQDITLYEYTDNYGKTKKRYDATAHMTFTITDGVTSQGALWFGVGSDYAVPDKALYKAITSGHKYFLAKLLCIGEGNEDSEHEPAEEEHEQKQAPKPANTPRPTKEIMDELGFQGAVVTEIKPEAPAKPANGNGNGTAKIVDWLMQSQLAESDFSAKGMIGLYNMPISTPDEKKAFMTWARNYRAWRNAGVESKAAAENAHAGTNPEA